MHEGRKGGDTSWVRGTRLDAKRGETEAAMAMLEHLAVVEGAETAVTIIQEDGGWRGMEEEGYCR